jgi:hypothetical protein
MKYKPNPQIFHDKEDKPKNFVMYPTDLFTAINHLCSGNEAKVLLALLSCKGDGSFSPTTKYMLDLTGIPKPNHFHSVRKALTDKGYLEEKDGDVYIDTTKILKEYARASPK